MKYKNLTRTFLVSSKTINTFIFFEHKRSQTNNIKCIAIIFRDDGKIRMSTNFTGIFECRRFANIGGMEKAVIEFYRPRFELTTKIL